VPAGLTLENLTLIEAGLGENGSGAMTITHNFTWTANYIGPMELWMSLTVDGEALLGGTGAKRLYEGGSLTLNGPTHITESGPLQIARNAGSGSVIANHSTMTLEPGARIESLGCCVNPVVLTNAGSIRVPSAGTASIENLKFVDDGHVSVAPSGVLDVKTGPTVLRNAQSLEGGGTILFEGGELALAEKTTITKNTTMHLAGSIVTGSGGLLGEGKLDWSGGTLVGTLRVAKTLTTSIDGGENKLISTSRGEGKLELAGPTTVSGGGSLRFEGPAQLVTSGGLTLSPGATVLGLACCVNPSVWTNSGTVVGPTSGSVTLSAFAFHTTGKVKFGKGAVKLDLGATFHQTAGSTELSGGALTSAEPVNVEGGTLAGYGEVAGPVVNSGTLSPSPEDLLRIAGAYTQGTRGTLEVHIEGLTAGHGLSQLAVTGPAALDGAIEVITGGGFKPSKGQAVRVLLYGSSSTHFATLRGGPSYTVTYQTSVGANVVFAGEPEVISVGDSFISGEGGRWAGNTNKSSSGIDALGSKAYFDNAAGTAEAIPFCHRSKSAEVHISSTVIGQNLACSGAQTETFTDSEGHFKPGLDFYKSGGEEGQVLQLENVAKGHYVKLVVISIGGNNFNFGSIVEQCVKAYITAKKPCSTETSVTNNFAAANVTKQTGLIQKAIERIATAMTKAGYKSTEYTILVQNYPTLVPEGAPQPEGFRYPESGLPDRQEAGGCGLYNVDANWANRVALPTIDNAVFSAGQATKLTNVAAMDVSHAFNNRLLCEKGDLLLEEAGLSSWTAAGWVDKAEWINQIRALSRAPYTRQEGLHPNYWGQLALRSCLRQAYNSGSPHGGKCIRSAPGLDNKSPPEPNMTLSP
jgi:hypothetical protein